MKPLMLSICLASFTTVPAVADEPPALTAEMLEVALGEDWTGELTYLNYQEPFEDVTIRANAEIAAIENGLEIAYKYPDEPHANSSVRARISPDGKSFMGEPIVSNVALDGGARQIDTRFSCEDMGRAATCEMTYYLSTSLLEITKMVTYVDNGEPFRRNSYAFSR